jgi:hypothetical protein
VHHGRRDPDFFEAQNSGNENGRMTTSTGEDFWGKLAVLQKEMRE